MPDPAARFRSAIDLHEAGVQIMRLQLRRKHPQASEEELARRFFEWLKGPDEDVPGRPNDAADLLALTAEADHEELQRCAGALHLITQRGFHRGRDLQTALADLRRACGRA